MREFRWSRRAVVAAGLVALACGLHPSAASAAETYPTKAIRLIVGYAPGGGADILARLLSAPLAEKLGQPVVVENRPGGGQNVGSSAVATSPADGYTLLFSSSALSVNISLYAKLNYDPVRDFVPVALVGESPNLLLVTASRPFTGVQDLLKFARDNPQKLNFSSSGNGSTQHLSGELLKLRTGVAMTHVPYKGTAPSLNAVASGEVDLTFSNLPSAKSALEAKRVRALAITSRTRSALYPDIPTMIESGLENFEVAAWYGVLAPAKTPPAVVQKLNGLINAIVGTAEFRQRLERMGVQPRTETPAAFAKFLGDDIARWREVIQKANIAVQ